MKKTGGHGLDLVEGGGFQGELPEVLANEAALLQCFSNLLYNVVKFVPVGQSRA